MLPNDAEWRALFMIFGYAPSHALGCVVFTLAALAKRWSVALRNRIIVVNVVLAVPAVLTTARFIDKNAAAWIRDAAYTVVGAELVAVAVLALMLWWRRERAA